MSYLILIMIRQNKILNIFFMIDIWLFNGTREMIDLEEYDRQLVENDDKNPHMVICEVMFIWKNDLISTHFIPSLSYLENHKC